MFDRVLIVFSFNNRRGNPDMTRRRERVDAVAACLTSHNMMKKPAICTRFLCRIPHKQKPRTAAPRDMAVTKQEQPQGNKMKRLLIASIVLAMAAPAFCTIASRVLCLLPQPNKLGLDQQYS